MKSEGVREMENKNVLNEEEMEKLKLYAERLHLPDKLTEEYTYLNPTVIIVNAILSKNRNYDNVQGWVKNFQTKYDGISTLIELIKVIDQETPKIFSENIRYKHESRINEIKEVASVFIKMKDNSEEDDLEVMQNWAKNTTYTNKEDPILKVKGIGIATFQYLRILLGVETCKPDVQIKKFLETALNKDKTEKKFSEEEAIEIIEELSKELNVGTRILDNSIWNYMRSKEEIENVTVEDMMYYIDFMNKEKLVLIQQYLEKRIKNLTNTKK